MRNRLLFETFILKKADIGISTEQQKLHKVLESSFSTH